MTIASVPELVDAIRRFRLLDPAHQQKLEQLQGRFQDPKLLARRLQEGNWLTLYQLRQLFQRGAQAELNLGPYIILDRLGQGGMGTVYKARNSKLQRLTALKVIRKEKLGKPESVQRFYREVRAAAQLSHPNVVLAFDAGECDGTHYFAMEYVDGVDLGKLLKQHGPLPVEAASEYIRQAACGLAHAHEKGLVHRDLKPSNLLLARAGRKTGVNPATPDLSPTPVEGVVVKVLDLGLALVGWQEPEGAAALTQEGAVVGTPDYTAPEQMLNSRAADIRSDLYSLGCTLYHLLTGQVPFPGGTLAQKLLKHQMHAALPVENLRPEVPPHLAAVVARLLAKDPAERFQTPVELAAVLGGQALPAPIAVAAVAAIPLGPPPGDEAATTDWAALAVPSDAVTTTPIRTAIAAIDETVAGNSSVDEARLQPQPEPADEAAPRVPRRRTLALGVGIGGSVGALLLIVVLFAVFAANRAGKSQAQSGASPTASKPEGRYVKMLTREDTILATLQAHGLPSLTGQWHYLGPFDNTVKTGFAAVYPPEQSIDLQQAQPGKNGQAIRWLEAPGFMPGRIYDIKQLPLPDWSVIYFYHEITVPERQQLEVSLGSDDMLKVWCNGELLVSHGFDRAAKADQNFATLNLRPGKNQLLAKVCQGGGAWAFYIMPRWPQALEKAYRADLDRDFPPRPRTP
ncbi:MAG: serine/threonine protein kinase [Planctomycetia bacterium]|nr:serine/threonine protein kinase [Planctomycetia bacterium]